MASIYNWGLKKPHHIRTAALQIASCAAEFQLVLSKVKEDELHTSFQIHDSASWLRLYQKPKHLTQFIFQTLLPHDPSAVNNLLEANHSYSSSRNNRYRLPDETLNKQWKDQVSQFIGNDEYELDDALSAIAKNTVQSVEFNFTLQIAIPCYFFYKEDHVTLFRKATSGNIAALDKLLRLDNYLIQHPRINRWFTHYSNSSQANSYHQIAKAMNVAPIGIAKLESMKISIGGLIAYVTEDLGDKLTVKDIRCLYDSIAKDTKGLGRDEDLTSSEDGFRKGITDQTKRWTELFEKCKEKK